MTGATCIQLVQYIKKSTVRKGAQDTSINFQHLTLVKMAKYPSKSYHAKGKDFTCTCIGEIGSKRKILKIILKENN